MEFIGGRSHRMAAWTHIRERENEGRTEDGGVVVIPSYEWGRFCYAHTVDGKKPDRRRKYLVALLA